MDACSFDPHGNYSVALAIVGVAWAIAWVKVARIRALPPTPKG